MNHLLWEPAIYEHKAALIGRSPAAVSRSAELLYDALCAEHAVYGADLLTVGIDIYNLEAEACGAQVRESGATECPDVAAPLFDLGALPAELDLPDLHRSGRFALMLDAAQRLRDHVAGCAAVRVAASGPVTIAAKLAGIGELVLSLALQDGQAERLLHFTSALAGAWLRAIREAGLDAVIFDSLAAPPILSPDLYTSAVAPLHRDLMTYLEASGQSCRPLVVGGDTTAIATRLAQTGANWLICDFPASASAFATALAPWPDVRVRRNVRPADLQHAAGIMDVAERYSADLDCFRRPVGGTGILPYCFEPSDFLEFRRAVNARHATGRRERKGRINQWT